MAGRTRLADRFAGPRRPTAVRKRGTATPPCRARAGRLPGRVRGTRSGRLSSLARRAHRCGAATSAGFPAGRTQWQAIGAPGLRFHDYAGPGHNDPMPVPSRRLKNLIEGTSTTTPPSAGQPSKKSPSAGADPAATSPATSATMPTTPSSCAASSTSAMTTGHSRSGRPAPTATPTPSCWTAASPATPAWHSTPPAPATSPAPGSTRTSSANPQGLMRGCQVANRPVYLALGVTVDGERDVLGLWAGEHGDGREPSTGCGSARRSRTGTTRDVLMVVCDGLKGMPDAVNAVWEKTIVQTCTAARQEVATKIQLHR
jgi:Transposase, Mutator family